MSRVGDYEVQREEGQVIPLRGVRGLLQRDELGQGYLTGDDAHSFHFAQQQRIYQQVYGTDQGVDGVDGRPQNFMAGSDNHSQDYPDPLDPEAEGETWHERRGNYLAFDEDHQPPYAGSPVTVERGYLPEGVWRPEDTPMCDPEAEEEEKEPEWNR
jgi:hypothetical protein